MSCSGSTYCFTNTGNNLINDTYISGGTHNSNLYYTGVTNNLFIYYSTTNNEWCLSTALNGSCLMSGDSPGPSQGCPDFSNFYFSEGLCPTPTPTPTSAVDCSDLDFEALFDCDVTPEPSPTSTPTPTPTPTITPTSTDLCGGVDIIATIESITPTPSPTPTITPTTSSPVVRPCTFSGDVTFNVIDGDIVCPYSFEFQDCYNGATYLTTSQVSSPSGGELEEFDIFNADVNGERRCISFIKINLLEIGGDVINLISGPIGKSNEGDCIYCGPSPSVTPTSTVTPTPTPTPTLPILGIQLEECCNGTSFILENYFGTNLTLGETYYYPFTGGTDICATVVPYTGLGQPYNYLGIGSPVLMPGGCDYLECPSCGDESYYVYNRCDDIKYWLVQTVSGSTITPGKVEKDTQNNCWEFKYISVGLPNLPPDTTIIYSGNYFLLSTTGVYDNCDDCSSCEPDSVQKKITSNKPMQVIKGDSNYHYVTFSNQSLGRYVIGDTQVDSVYTFPSAIHLRSVVFNPTNEKIYLVSQGNNQGFTIYDISTDSVTYEPTIPYVGLLGMVYNSINNSVYLLYAFNKVRIYNCDDGSITLLDNGELVNINNLSIQSVLYNPNENVIYYSAFGGIRLGVFDCNSQTSTTKYINNSISSFNLDISNNKLYIVTSSILKEVDCGSLSVSNIGPFANSPNGQSVFNPNNNKIYATDRGNSIRIYDLDTNDTSIVSGFTGNGKQLFGIIYDEDNDKIHACDFSSNPNGDVYIICPSD